MIHCAGSLTTNIGDYVALLTGGRFHSPLHRVVTGAQERTSFVFFSYPDYDARIPAVSDAGSYSLFSDQQQHARRHGGRCEAAPGAPIAPLPVVAQGTDVAASSRGGDGGGDSGAGPDDDVLAQPFGEFIRRKWESVSRSGAAY